MLSKYDCLQEKMAVSPQSHEGVSILTKPKLHELEVNTEIHGKKH